MTGLSVDSPKIQPVCGVIMRVKIETLAIRTCAVHTFSPDLQRAFIAMCQHIDWLFRQTGQPFRSIPYSGSASWITGIGVGDAKVAVKALPWDKRIRCLTQVSQGDEGIAILLRDEFLTKSDMRMLWEEYAQAYHPCPASPLYSVVPQHEKEFQLLLWCLGPGCDVFSLPGANPDEIDERLRRRLSAGVMSEGEGQIIQQDAVQNTDKRTSSSVEPSGETSRVVTALGDLMRRATS